MYTRSCTRKKKIWWKSSEKGSRDCRGSLSTTPDLDNPEPGLPHNHAADHINVTYTKCRNLMRQQAASSLDKPSQIFAQAVANQDLLCRSVFRVRRTPSDPSDITGAPHQCPNTCTTSLCQMSGRIHWDPTLSSSFFTTMGQRQNDHCYFFPKQNLVLLLFFLILYFLAKIVSLFPLLFFLILSF